MSVNTRIFSHILPAALIAATVCPGAWTVSQTSFEGMDWQIGNGAAQRLYEARFERGFPLADVISQGWTAAKLHAFGEVSEGAILGAGHTLFTAEEFLDPVESVDFSAVLEETQAVLDAADIDFIPVLIPDKARMQAHLLPHARSERFAARFDVALSEISALGRPAIDVRPALSEAHMFLRTDTHWSPEGAEGVAQLVATHMFAKALPSTVFHTEKVGERAFTGDLTSFANVGDWLDADGYFSETIAEYATTRGAQDGLDLFADVYVPVALVGTSFSARDAFHFEGFLKTALQADLLNHSKVGRGPFAPMRDFLEALPAMESKPELVIWEIPERYITPWRTK
ncbi:hypothetical protein J7382_04170 [Shimia sp. R11_0]|uniref:alginate O-acetyltransferase AlgX-related protein n=1 Tax=Shimia sp. R11_0 TaxID=2821096 RepID=UPI001ADC5BFC|nr:hypothetical protein [Shimia sp. R11_0]MBO9476725.1 hypothetical protein [Shimia sp. R11_0]